MDLQLEKDNQKNILLLGFLLFESSFRDISRKKTRNRTNEERDVVEERCLATKKSVKNVQKSTVDKRKTYLRQWVYPCNRELRQQAENKKKIIRKSYYKHSLKNQGFSYKYNL